MKIEIIKEFSMTYKEIFFRVYLDGVLVHSFSKFSEAKEYIKENKQKWKLKPEVVWSEEI